MNSVINIEEFRELLRKYKAKEYLTVCWIFFGIALFQISFALIFTLTSTEDFIETGIWFLIPVGLMFILFLVFFYLYKNTQNKPFSSKVFEQYKDYEAKGTKIPLYRVVSTGQSSQTIYMLLDIHGSEFELYDIKNRNLKLFLSGKMDELTCKFFYKEKKDIEYLKSKLHLITPRKTYKIQGITEVLDRFIIYLKSESYKLEIDHK